MSNSSKKTAQPKKAVGRKPQPSTLRNIIADVTVGTPDGATFDLRLAFPIDAAGGGDRGFKAGKDL